ncbi:hypothetical protein Salat_2540600 [Sesamum alatum]|uniref:Uncharacterized protein n=1 Tax=Sesamum alatum TaxID=300844 RepID=A0AAE1XSA8_9LAMI|nr:hypothetical protein Salat_2540600 [Sesamum alatum]
MNSRTLNRTWALRGTFSQHIVDKFEGIESSSSATPSTEKCIEGLALTKSNQASTTPEATPEPTPEPVEVERGTTRPPTPTPESHPLSKAGSASGSRGTKVESIIKGADVGPSGSKKRKRKHNHKSNDSNSSKPSKKRQDSLELFKVILCNRHQALLAKKSHTKASTFGNNLSLKCFVFWEDKKVLVAENTMLKSEVETLKEQIAEAKASKEGDKKGFKRAQAKGFDYRLTEDHARYLGSDDHKALLAAIHVEGARDFLKFVFGIALEMKNARSTLDAFELCHSQIKTFGGFVEGFDQNWLDPTLDAKLYIPNVADPIPADKNEFLC